MKKIHLMTFKFKKDTEIKKFEMELANKSSKSVISSLKISGSNVF